MGRCCSILKEPNVSVSREKSATEYSVRSGRETLSMALPIYDVLRRSLFHALSTVRYRNQAHILCSYRQQLVAGALFSPRRPLSTIINIMSLSNGQNKAPRAVVEETTPLLRDVNVIVSATGDEEIHVQSISAQKQSATNDGKSIAGIISVLLIGGYSVWPFGSELMAEEMVLLQVFSSHRQMCAWSWPRTAKSPRNSMLWKMEAGYLPATCLHNAWLNHWLVPFRVP